MLDKKKLSSKCFFYFLSSFPRWDTVLINHVIAQYQVASALQCAQQCMRKCGCVSFNYGKGSATKSSLLSCHINKEKQQNDPQSSIAVDGFHYFELKVCREAFAWVKHSRKRLWSKSTKRWWEYVKLENCGLCRTGLCGWFLLWDEKILQVSLSKREKKTFRKCLIG